MENDTSGGVASDQGTPGAPFVDASGKVVVRMFKLPIEMDREAMIAVIKSARVSGQTQLAAQCEKALGETVKVTFIDRHQVAAGIAIGLGSAAIAAGATWGVTKYVKARRAKKAALEQTTSPRRLQVAR